MIKTHIKSSAKLRMNKENFVAFLHSLISHEYTCNIKLKFKMTHNLSSLDDDFSISRKISAS